MVSIMYVQLEIQIFCEGHKVLKKAPQCFWHYLVTSNKVGRFLKIWPSQNICTFLHIAHHRTYMKLLWLRVYLLFFLLLHTNTAVIHFQAELSDFSYYFTDANCLSALIHIGAKIYMKISHERFWVFYNSTRSFSNF